MCSSKMLNRVIYSSLKLECSQRTFLGFDQTRRPSLHGLPAVASSSLYQRHCCRAAQVGRSICLFELCKVLSRLFLRVGHLVLHARARSPQNFKSLTQLRWPALRWSSAGESRRPVSRRGARKLARAPGCDVPRRSGAGRSFRIG
jgi:hypothetical protein